MKKVFDYTASVRRELLNLQHRERLVSPQRASETMLLTDALDPPHKVNNHQMVKKENVHPCSFCKKQELLVVKLARRTEDISFRRSVLLLVTCSPSPSFPTKALWISSK